MPGAKSVTVMVMVGAGSRYETREINGLSHFLEHMAFKGTKKRPSAEAISREIDAIGGEFNAFTSKDHTAFYIKAASQHLDLMLDILSDMLTNSLFKEEEIEREKGVIIEEINMHEDTPMRKVAEVFENLMFGDTPMGWDIAGKTEIIREIKRADFIKYVDSLYKTGNMVISIAGGINQFSVFGSQFSDKSLPVVGQSVLKTEKQKTDKPISENRKQRTENRDLLHDKVEYYFGKLRDNKTISFTPLRMTQDKPRLRIQYKKTEQAHLVLGFPSLAIDDPRKYALSILTTILGGGMSSRLFIQVRERRGLAYYVRASSDAYKDCGDFTVSAGVDLKRIDEAVKVILEEIYIISPQAFVETRYCASHHEKQFVVRDVKSDLTKNSVGETRDGASLHKNDNKNIRNNLHKICVNPGGNITDSELRKAKEYLKGHLILGLEDSESVAGLYASQFLLEKLVETPEEIIAAIDKVTLDEVYSLAREIFNPKKVNLAVIGPFEDEERFRKLINK